MFEDNNLKIFAPHKIAYWGNGFGSRTNLGIPGSLVALMVGRDEDSLFEAWPNMIGVVNRPLRKMLGCISLFISFLA
ncbi:MAG: hypothetical protein GX773_02130 [Chloroflexi bacterium]|nr:hypothetical protein [Chloroflexota bacterium]